MNTGRPLREGVDFVFNDQGLMVLTREFLSKRGYCCQSGCQNCPWGYAAIADPNVPAELSRTQEGPDWEIDMADKDDDE